MPGFTTTDEGGWVFSFEDKPDIQTELPMISPSDPNTVEPPNYLGKPDKWKNYTDMILYEAELLLRKFFELKQSDKNWTCSAAYYRRNTLGMIYVELYGEPVNNRDKLCQKRMRRLSNLLAYYSTRIQKEGSVRGKKTNKKIYTLSLKRYEKLPPYSLRLRIEWLAEQGKVPCWQNMKLPKDDLKPGHARNPKTDENMEKRRERAKERHNEKYNRHRKD